MDETTLITWAICLVSILIAPVILFIGSELNFKIIKIAMKNKFGRIFLPITFILFALGFIVMIPDLNISELFGGGETDEIITSVISIILISVCVMLFFGLTRQFGYREFMKENKSIEELSLGDDGFITFSTTSNSGNTKSSVKFSPNNISITIKRNCIAIQGDNIIFKRIINRNWIEDTEEYTINSYEISKDFEQQLYGYINLMNNRARI